MKGIIVAREKCGCVAAAWLSYDTSDAKAFGEAVAEWMESGYVVALEDRETVYAEKCLIHQQASEILNP